MQYVKLQPSRRAATAVGRMVGWSTGLSIQLLLYNAHMEYPMQMSFELLCVCVCVRHKYGK